MATSRSQRAGRTIVCLIAMLLALDGFAFGQTEQHASAHPISAPGDKVAGVYTIGPADILDIVVADSPEISGKYRIPETGDLSLPQLPTPIKATGATTLELSEKIARALKDADILREPVVSVFVQEYHSQTVMVLGAVAKPGVYALEKRTTVLEVLSMAGGLTPTAGGMLTITHNDASLKKKASSGNDRSQVTDENAVKIDLGKLVSGKDSSLNVEAQPGDAMIVANAPVVYVVGAVVKPGGFPIQDSTSGLTVLQAIALVEGLGPAALPKRAVIVRRSESSKEREEIHVNLTAMMTGKLRDQSLEGNDILFVPTSSFKKGVKTVSDAAVQAATTAAGYGAGLRIGPY